MVIVAIVLPFKSRYRSLSLISIITFIVAVFRYTLLLVAFFFFFFFYFIAFLFFYFITIIVLSKEEVSESESELLVELESTVLTKV